MADEHGGRCETTVSPLECCQCHGRPQRVDVMQEVWCVAGLPTRACYHPAAPPRPALACRSQRLGKGVHEGQQARPRHHAAARVRQWSVPCLAPGCCCWSIVLWRKRRQAAAECSVCGESKPPGWPCSGGCVLLAANPAGPPARLPSCLLFCRCAGLPIPPEALAALGEEELGGMAGLLVAMPQCHI